MKRALVSVTDKTGVVDFCKGLVELGYEIISTGGTKKVLDASGVKTLGISEVTGFPEILDGRVKTLHPNVHGGLLAVRDNPDHVKQLKEHNIEYIDLVCVNLYAFKKTIEKGAEFAEAIENIDIGGPSMLRSAAKNHKFVTVVSDVNDYDKVLAEIKEYGDTTYETRLKLAAKVYTLTAEYDTMIATYLREKAGLEEKLFIEADVKQELRYGENPHQSAKFYVTDKDMPYSLANAKQIQGKELSYNNIQDANAALNIVKEFGNQPFALGLKHMNPCGAAVGKDLKEAWLKAYESDPVSIFGGIVATNQVIDKEAANLIKFDHGEKGKSIFLEVILAPGFTDEALEAFAKRPDLRIIQYKLGDFPKTKQYLSVNGGLLVQDLDTEMKEVTMDMTITNCKPTKEQLADMNFGWKIVKHVKSNAIVVVKNGVTCGVGAGQMNRVGAAKIAIEEAHSRGVKDGLVLASDAFFPFSDTLEYGIENGVCAVVQPGGSKRDQDSIDLANEKNIPMTFTGMRHFKH
ncbi:MAG: bifunctional phosphoribosylaminoimidazolecarboxamide formyltransferase/IMP cyclohydrolase [Acholeplasmatales bacterium]|nr:bifunctional phosphoribosylaminoimidazolecarboxamide formyltransferase/IMP cyclohydrolase [Acholeplasmatales bacterium]